MESEGPLRPRVVESTSPNSGPSLASTLSWREREIAGFPSPPYLSFQPFVPPDRHIPEFTAAPVVLGFALAGSLWWMAGRSKAEAYAPPSKVYGR